jgi:anti-sigma28 factor (negative regulator of flagellin synthesis)
VNIARTAAPDSLLELSDSLELATNATGKTSGAEARIISSEADSPMDSVSLSSTSSPEREMHLRAVKEAIGNGTYNVSASKVADAMLKRGL